MEASEQTGGRPELVRAIEQAILGCEGDLPPGLRRSGFRRAISIAKGDSNEPDGLGEPLGDFVDKVARHSYKVTDEDVAALKVAGYSEDAIFETIVATAVGAGSGRLALGLRALEKGR